MLTCMGLKVVAIQTVALYRPAPLDLVDQGGEVRSENCPLGSRRPRGRETYVGAEPWISETMGQRVAIRIERYWATPAWVTDKRAAPWVS